MQWAVLTGDIVDSSAMAPAELDQVMDAIQACALELRSWTSSDTTAPNAFAARRGGDEWQLAFDAPELHLRAALYVRACVALAQPGAATRIAVATGDGTLPSSPDPVDLNSAHGAAFQASGRLLGKLKGRRQMAFARKGPVAAVYALADHISQGWTQAQAKSLAPMLRPTTLARKEVAEAIGISRQAVDQALRASGYAFISNALSEIEAA